MAAQGVASFGDVFNHIDGTTGSAEGVGFGQLGVQSSPLYGGKVGYYFDEPGWKWLGIEMEAFTSTQHLKQQGVQVDPGFGAPSDIQLTRGQNIRVTNWAPINIMFRYQIGRSEPYVGAGLGIYFLHIHNAATDTSISSNANLGLSTLSTKGGLRWRVTDHLSVFAEWKYNQVNFNYDNLPIGSTTGGGHAQYHTHIGVDGIGWHF